jgi:large conductance mechanosensitive channel
MSDEMIQEKMLNELEKIRVALEPKPVPPAPAPKGWWEQFLNFLNKHGVVGLAIAVIIGGAASKLVASLVSDILMPIITFFIPGGAWREATLSLGPIVLLIGSFIGTLIDFIIIALVVFFLMKQVEKSGFK